MKYLKLMRAAVSVKSPSLLRIFALVMSSLCAPLVVAQTVEDYSVVPPTASNSSPPMVMLVMSRDNQLWHKAYNDYSNLDGDENETLETTYVDTFEYYGYFNSGLCYRYDADVYRPAAFVEDGTHRCSGLWSGNFLNWLTTTRIDVVRKVLFGGYRSTDSADSTILQRAFIPPDNHAFVKIVKNSDIDGTISDYTPITGESELSFCNVTNGSGISGRVDTTAHLPLLKVARGVRTTWAGSEMVQCLFQHEGGPTLFSPALPDPLIRNIPTTSSMVVRVETCIEGFDRNECREYYSASGAVAGYKPYGLLQKYGESGRFKFGLMTGSYQNNTQGGVLRKNIAFMGGQSAASEDLEVDLNTGIFIPKGDGEQGIISTLNALRIQGWNYETASYYDCNVPGISINNFKSSLNENWQCRDWGNPITEIYLEALRYFAGATPTEAFEVDDSGIIDGLLTETWVDPMTEETACANCSILVLSTGLNNFDGDQLDSAASLPGLDRPPMLGGDALREVTDIVGRVEGLDGRYIVGSAVSGGGNNGECDDKSLENGLGRAHGLCPESATLEGSYNIAGAAYYAHERDLRDDYEGRQKIKTYTVSLAETLPTFKVATQSGNTVSFVPSCRSRDSFTGGHHTDFDADETLWYDNRDWLECSLVDLTVAEQTDTYGRLLISWEDSSWGNDYDMDAYSVIEYCTATGSESEVRRLCPDYTGEESDNELVLPRHRQQQWASAGSSEIQLRVSMIAASAGFAMKFGYVMNGSEGRDAPYGEEILRPGGYDGNSEVLTGPEGTNYVLWSNQTRKFRASDSTPGLLRNPLWYAAKYGNFGDEEGGVAADQPDHIDEWDRYTLEVDEFGARVEGRDDIPDAFFPVSNPANLPLALSTIFNDFSQRLSSGSAAAVNSQTGRGEGAVYQALFAARKEGADNEEVVWIGDVNGLFLDSFGHIREDNGNGALDDGDLVLQFDYDEEANEARVQRYTRDRDGNLTASGASFGLTDAEFQPLWSAQEGLRSLASYDVNRSYSDSAANGRYIFTAFDRDGDGQIIEPIWSATNPGQSAGQDGVHAFTKNNFRLIGATENDYRYLGMQAASTQEQVNNLVDFVRGVENLPGMRSRTLGGEAYLLGDIVHSAPEVVGKPNAKYHIDYDDETYRDFLDQYENRRHMIYVGANDGMLHAFNGGRFSSQNVAYTEDGHPLGTEMWSYIPYNLLPHLRWLASPNYPHVYYMDGPVRSYDVNIFPNDPTHPGGWGTIIVAGMRFGGGDYSLDHDNDSDTPNITTRSAYVILDVTDPEQPPTLIAEITDEDLGFTSVVPALVKNRRAGAGGDFSSPAENDWYLVFGSGPGGNNASERRQALESAVSTKPARVYVFDLVSKTLTDTLLPEASTFVGGVASGDWDGDFVDDAIYFGLVNGTPLSPSGKLVRGEIRSFSGSSFTASYTDLYNQRNLAFSAVPRTYADGNDFWIYAGTGRFYSGEDNLSVQPQYFFGIKEPKDGSTLGDGNLVDVTEVVVFEDGRVKEEGHTQVTLRANGETDGTINRFGDVQRFVRNHGDGWMFGFRHPRLPHGDIESFQGIRTFTQASLAGETLVLTAYEASMEYCGAEGVGYSYTPYFDAGVPAPFLGQLDEDYPFLPAEGEEDIDMAHRVLGGITLGPGLPSDPKVVQTTDGGESNCDDYVVFVQSSTAKLDQQRVGCEEIPPGRKSWLEIPVGW